MITIKTKKPAFNRQNRLFVFMEYINFFMADLLRPDVINMDIQIPFLQYKNLLKKPP